MKKFTIKVTTSGNLISSYVFQNEKSFQKWKEKTFPKLEQKYGKLMLIVCELPGLVVGDHCHVIGEGSDIFKIIKLFRYSPNRYGFALDSGWNEEVAKCYAVEKIQ